MYLFSQLAFYLFLTFLLGIGVGYGLWRIWGEQEAIAKFNAAEMRLAAHLSRWEKSAAHPDAASRDVPRQARSTSDHDVPPEVPRPNSNLEKRWDEPPKRKLQEI